MLLCNWLHGLNNIFLYQAIGSKGSIDRLDGFIISVFNPSSEIRQTSLFTEGSRGGLGVCFHISVTCIDLRTAVGFGRRREPPVTLH